jgi:amino-acid N-acetyltransferase
MSDGFLIRAARLGDAERIFAMIHLNRDQLISRSVGNIVENIDRFFVAEASGEIAGCATYQVHPELGDAKSATVEVQSLVVKSAFRRRGIGRALVDAVVDRVAGFGPRDVVALTFAPEFFASLGFVQIPKTKIMHKLYTGCINCAKHTNPFVCPEIAMMRSLEGAVGEKR